jgi:hypothetical protein
MKDMRYIKLKGAHAGHIYVVAAPYDEIESPMRWILRCETIADKTIIVGEDKLADKNEWKPAH